MQATELQMICKNNSQTCTGHMCLTSHSLFQYQNKMKAVDKELRFCFCLTEQNLIISLLTSPTCFHWTELWRLFVQNSRDNLRNKSTDNSQTILGHEHWKKVHEKQKKKLAFWAVLIWQKDEHFMPTMQRPVSVISLKGAKAWCLTQHPLKRILNTVKATWGAEPMHLSPLGLGLLLTP